MSFCFATSGTSIVMVLSRRAVPQQPVMSSVGFARGLIAHQFIVSRCPEMPRKRQLHPLRTNVVHS